MKIKILDRTHGIIQQVGCRVIGPVQLDAIHRRFNSTLLIGYIFSLPKFWKIKSTAPKTLYLSISFFNSIISLSFSLIIVSLTTYWLNLHISTPVFHFFNLILLSKTEDYHFHSSALKLCLANDSTIGLFKGLLWA